MASSMPPTFWGRLWSAGLIAGAGFLSAAPYLDYVSRIGLGLGRAGRRALGPFSEDRVMSDLASIALEVTIASLVGVFFSERYGLVGKGDLKSVKRAWAWILIAGPLLALGGYLVFGRVYAERAPGIFPTSLSWALVLMLKGAVFDEVVCRFGMMTIAMGVSRRFWTANVLQATFFTVVGLKGMQLHGLAPDWGVFLFADLASAFVMHVLQGFVCARHGLLASIALHFMRELRLPLHFILSAL